MAAPEVHHLFHNPIADHSFFPDRKTLAIARDSTVELYGKVGNAFKLKDELKGHDKTVTSVDVCPVSGRIVSCSQDRNALVWEPSPQGYKPTLVLLRISRAATFVRWSPSETKFAVGSGDRVIAVCYFEEENDWWVSKHLKKPIRSTITSVAWHPNSVLLAAGSTDAHARVFSSFIKGVDQRPEPGVWGERLPFNTVCGEYLNNSAGWVHSVAFSPSGDALAFAAHDSSITVVYPSAPEQPPRAIVSITTQLLPFMSIFWSNETEIIAAGYDCEAFRFKGDEGGWQLAGTLESKGRPGLGDAREESALNMFRQMDLKGKVKDDTKLQTVHQNTISTIRPYETSGSQVTKFSCNAQISSMEPTNMVVTTHPLMERSQSPSARFYASRSATPSPPEAPRLTSPQGETIGPFGHWAVSYPNHSTLSGTSHCDLPHDEAQVSPRTIPAQHSGPSYLNILPEDRIRELHDDSEGQDEPVVSHLPFRWHEHSIAATPGLHRASPSAAWPAQRETYISPPQFIMPATESQAPTNMDTPEFAHIPIGASSLPDDAPTQAWDPYGSDLEDGEIQEDEPSGNGDSMDQDNTSLKSGEASPSPSPSDSTPSSSSSSSGDSASRGAILLRAVHDACLMATQRYLRSHRSNWRLRNGSRYPPRSAAGNGSSPAGSSPHSTQSSPHGSSAGSDAVESHGHSNSPLGSPPRSGPNNNIDTFVPTGTDSVLANTAAICTLMWRRAQATRLLSLGAESAAIADMRKLTVWAEVVVLTSRRARVAPDPALAVAYIIAAGRALCRFLEDEDALAMIDDALPIQWIEVDLDLDYLGSLVH